MDSKMVQRCASIARRAHDGQKRWGGEDYFLAHVEPVALAAQRLYGDEAACVAYLHDVLEDTEVTTAQLRGEGIPEPIVYAVEALTRRDNERYADYVMRAAMNPLARGVKLCDLESNLASLDPKRDKQRKEKYELAKILLQFMALRGHR